MTRDLCNRDFGAGERLRRHRESERIRKAMGSSIEVLREQMAFLLEQGLHDSAEMLVRATD